MLLLLVYNFQHAKTKKSPSTYRIYLPKKATNIFSLGSKTSTLKILPNIVLGKLPSTVGTK